VRIIAACILALTLAGCASMAGVKKADPSTLRELTPDERAFLTAQFSKDMKDPAATQFKWAKIGPPNDKGIAWYCGMVNGKNSYGGYVGFQVFDATVTYSGGKIVGASIIGIASDPTEASVTREWCDAYGLDPDSAM
jgi:hypothetical protein